jgi:prophage antirepressor-like protein
MTIANTTAIFNFNAAQIHAFADDNGELWFSAKDVCSVLGYNNDTDALCKHCRDRGVKKCTSFSESENIDIAYIDEGNVYRLIINSRKEEAQIFENKLSAEILPTIRKTVIDTASLSTDKIPPAHHKALQQIAIQRFGNSVEILTAIRNRFNAHFQIEDCSMLPADRFLEAVAFLTSQDRYQYPRTMLDQQHFIPPDEDTAYLSLSMLTDATEFKSPLMSLLNQLSSDGYDVTAPLEEAIAMQNAMRKADQFLDDLGMLTLKAKYGRL